MILLVTGSRSLASYPGARERVEVVLRYLITEHKARGVLHGGAVGVDTWAHEVTKAMRDEGAEHFALPAAMRPKPGEHPLDRNRRMVAYAASRHTVHTPEAAVLHGPQPVLCVGFVDPASRTRGADHTLTLAAKAGIPTLRLEWGR